MDELTESGRPRTLTSTCAHHPDRTGHALCMSCRKVVCQECATEWDGINYCVACLAQKRGAARRGTSLVGAILVTVAAAALFVLAARVLVWAGVLAMELS